MDKQEKEQMQQSIQNYTTVLNKAELQTEA